jgi:hydrogenase expression/formation protein HypC
MCLAVPARVVELIDAETAVVELGGIRREVSIALVDDVAPGAFLLIHVGFALGKVDTADAEATLALLDLQADAAAETGGGG